LANAEAHRFFGYDQQELLGLEFENLIPKRFRKRHITHHQAYFQDAKVRPMGSGMELFCLLKNGDEIPIEVGLSPLRTDDGVLVCVTIRDIREHQQAVTAMREAQARAETALAAKSRFLATAKH
jgi:two-component system, chemotaxis family, CheB/CheR fusion protein